MGFMTSRASSDNQIISTIDDSTSAFDVDMDVALRLNRPDLIIATSEDRFAQFQVVVNPQYHRCARIVWQIPG